MTHTVEEVRAFIDHMDATASWLTPGERDIAAAYAALLEQREAGVTDEIVERVAKAIAADGMGREFSDLPELHVNGLDKNDLINYARAALNAVWPVAAEPVQPADSGRVTKAMVRTALHLCPTELSSPEKWSWVATRLNAALAAQGQPAERIHPIATDDDVENIAALCGWNNRRYMTPADYSIWCQRMRKFVSLATQPGESNITQESQSNG